MKAKPKKSPDDILKLLPKHLHGGGGGEGPKPLEDGTPGQGHAPIPALASNALNSATHPNAETENRALNMDIAAALANRKRLVAEDQGVSRFVIVWRMFPNPRNPVVATGDPDKCGCGCSCGG